MRIVLSPRTPTRRSPSFGSKAGPGVLHVVAGLHHHADLGLADGQDAGVFEPGERARVRHVGVHHAGGIRVQPVDGGMDAVARELHLPFAREAGAVEADLHERGCGHLRPVQPERDLQVAILLARNGEGQVIEDSLLKSVHHGKPVGRGEIDAGLPFGLGVSRLSRRQGGNGHLAVLLVFTVGVGRVRTQGPARPERRLCAIRGAESRSERTVRSSSGRRASSTRSSRSRAGSRLPPVGLRARAARRPRRSRPR